MAAPGIEGCSFHPYFSAVSTSRLGPTLAPSGANTELHDWANDSTKLPPQDSPLALESGTPESSAEVWTGNWSESLTLWSSNAAVVVMILNVEPGGWRPSSAIPDRASTSPVGGSITATPPNLAPSAELAARWSRGSIEARTGPAAAGCVLASTRRPANRRPPAR